MPAGGIPGLKPRAVALDPNMPSGEGEDGGFPAIPADQDVDLDAGAGCGKAL
jgi:hypothetical protein